MHDAPPRVNRVTSFLTQFYPVLVQFLLGFTQRYLFLTQFYSGLFHFLLGFIKRSFFLTQFY